jgi:anti-sigma B factor antagonist
MHAVTVHQVPAQVTAATERSFLGDLQKYVETARPRLVLDCSELPRIDAATIHLLLCCLEEVMKRNGDAKLASLPPGGEAMLQLAGVNHLFETYANAADAVYSFRQNRAGFRPLDLVDEDFPRSKSENVA